MYLRGMQRTLAAFEAASAVRDPSTPARARPSSPRMQALDDDLRALALAPLPAATFEPDGAAGWLGASYVIEGSALGARMLLRQLQALPGPVPPAAFLQAHAAAGDGWRDCLARLESRPECETPAILAGALALFAIVESSFALAAERSR